MTAETAAPAAPAPHARLSQLDGLRGIAALIIMLYHLDAVFHIGGPFQRGYILVDLFFLLSGFVIAVSTEKKLNAGIGALDFTRARFVRLWPLVAVGACVAGLYHLIAGSAPPLRIAASLALDLAMIPVLSGGGPFYRLNGPQWTLFWELVVNFLHALLLRRVPTRWLPLLAALLGAGLFWTVRKHGGDTLGVSALTWQTWYMPIPRVGWSYVMGVWLGRLYAGGLRTPTLPWWLALALPVVGAALMPSLPLSRANGDLVIALVFLPAVMWLAAMSRPPQWIMPKLDWLGAFSLPLYCVHLTILVSFEHLGRAPWVMVAAVAGSVAVAWGFFRLVSFGSKPTAVKTGAA